MTKRRDPISFADALTRIAVELGGWDALATVVGRARSTVYNWANPDTPESCPIDLAPTLDLAFQEAGGDGAPLLDAYASQIEAARLDRFATQFGLTRQTAAIIKEGGEAHAALVRCTLPDAGPHEFAIAAREVQEAVRELTAILPDLARGTGPAGGGAADANPGGKA